jgi:hypothetical protein
MTKNLKWLIPVLSLFLTFCQKTDIATIQSFTIQAELQPYFNSFAAEALKRGVTVDITQVGGELTDIADAKVAGQCQYSSATGHHVLIDLPYWNTATALKREFVVFHELGHCLLNRTHLDDANADGTCASIMTSGSGGCKSVYTQLNRSSYLEELFLHK